MSRAGRQPARRALDEHGGHACATGGDVHPAVADEPRAGEVEVERFSRIQQHPRCRLATATPVGPVVRAGEHGVEGSAAVNAWLIASMTSAETVPR